MDIMYNINILLKKYWYNIEVIRNKDIKLF